jgi:hypothetical protein
MTDRTFELIDKHLNPEDYELFASGEFPPSEDDLRAVARELGCELPPEFVAHSINQLGGLYVAVNENLWPRPEKFAVGPFWSFLYGLCTLSITAEIPDFMNLETQAKNFQKETGHTAIPILKIMSDPNVYCVEKQGAMVRWDHESNEFSSDGKTFFEILDFELGELADRKRRKFAKEDVM